MRVAAIRAASCRPHRYSPLDAQRSAQRWIAVEDILEGLFADLASDRRTTSVVQGAPGTGKTIVAIYLIKLLRDIAEGRALGDTTTLADPNVVSSLKDKYESTES